MFSCPLIRFTGVLYEKFIKHERWIFLLFLLITLLQLWLTRFIPSLDGPQHLYNANVMVELLKGNELMRSFFDINEVVVGYWTGHFFLAFFKLFFPAWLAEKLFLTVYVLGLVFSFRYLVRSLNPAKGNFVAYLVFPFVYHMYLLMGYYSFSIGVIFFFFAFGYWIRFQDQMNFKRMVIFGMIVLGIFLSHGLVYVFFGLSFVLYFLATHIYKAVTNAQGFKLSAVLTKIWKVTLAILPSLILWVIYIRSVMSINNTVVDASYSFSELFNFLLRIRQLVGFNHEMEALGYIPLVALMVLLTFVFIALFVGGIKDKSTKWISLLSDRNSWILIMLAFLCLYLFAPDRISAGSLTNRFGLFFFFALITWLSFQKFPKTFQVIALVLIFFSVSYTRIIHQRFYYRLNKDIAEIHELSEHMKPNSVVYYQQATYNWTHIHFQLYAAVDDPLVHLKNPQCQGQFPVVWNLDELPKCYAGEKEVQPAGASREKGKEYPKMKVDYVTVFDNDTFWADSTNAEWHNILRENYEEIYVSSKGKAALWEKK